MPKSTIAGIVRSTHGYSLVDLLVTCMLIGVIAGIAVPALSNAVESQRVGMEARNVEREMQLARLNAVTTNRPIRVRFNCPSPGSYRRVELLGSINSPNQGDDSDSQGVVRCDTLHYPYPAADQDPLTRPNNDGPIRRLNTKVTFSSSQTLEFWPNGTVHVVNNTTTWDLIGTTPVNIILTQGTTTRAISVNSLGKMQIQ